MSTVVVVAGVFLCCRVGLALRVRHNQSIEQLKLAASSMTAAGAARVVRPHLPIKRILQQFKDDLAEPQTGRP